jgi:hypothetical protein
MQAGTNMAKQWIDTYNQAQTQRGLRKLGPQASVVSGNTFEVDGATGLVADGEMGVDRNGRQVTVQQAYQNANDEIESYNSYSPPSKHVQELKIGPKTGLGFATRAGSYDAGVHTDAKLAQQGVDRYNTGLKRAQADVYRQFGNDTMGMSLDNNAAEGERYARTEARQAARDLEEQRRWDTEDKRAGDLHLTQKGLSQQQGDMNKHTLDKQNQALLDQTAAGELVGNLKPGMTPDQIRDSAKNLSPAAQRLVFEHLVTTNKAETDILRHNVVKAITQHGQTLAGVLKLHKEDPNFDPDGYFEATYDDKGGVTLQPYRDAKPNGKPLSFKSEMEAHEHLIRVAQEPWTLLEAKLTRDAREVKAAQEAAESASKIRLQDKQGVALGAQARASDATGREAAANIKANEADRKIATGNTSKKQAASKSKVSDQFLGLK